MEKKLYVQKAQLKMFMEQIHTHTHHQLLLAAVRLPPAHEPIAELVFEQSTNMRVESASQSQNRDPSNQGNDSSCVPFSPPLPPSFLVPSILKHFMTSFNRLTLMMSCL